MTQPPRMNRYARHVLFCTGHHCGANEQTTALYAYLRQLLADHRLSNYETPHRVKRSSTSCLGVCGGAPVLVVYPEGIWYHHVDEVLLERIVVSHLRDGQPLWEHVFHQLDADGDHHA